MVRRRFWRKDFWGTVSWSREVGVVVGMGSVLEVGVVWMFFGLEIGVCEVDDCGVKSDSSSEASLSSTENSSWLSDSLGVSLSEDD